MSADTPATLCFDCGTETTVCPWCSEPYCPDCDFGRCPVCGQSEPDETGIPEAWEVEG